MCVCVCNGRDELSAAMSTSNEKKIMSCSESRLVPRGDLRAGFEILKSIFHDTVQVLYTVINSKRAVTAAQPRQIVDALSRPVD